MEAVSKLRNIPMSARKMRLVVDIIRGKDVDQALDILKYTKKEAAVWVEKALLSAISNWENKNSGAADADPDSLFVKEIFSDQGSMLKRFRPAPHGRAHRIRKHTNHVTIVVDSRNPVGPVVEDAVEVEEVETSED